MNRSAIKYLLVFICLLFAFSAKAYYDPGKPEGFVNDFANILIIEEKNILESKLSQFEKNSTNEISVITINDLQGDTIENFANQLHNEWGIGKKGKDNGILVFVAIQDRKMRIEVGYGLEGSVTDAQASWIISDVMRPAFQQGKYFQGIDGATNKIIAAIDGEILPAQSNQSSKNNPSAYKEENIILIFWMIGLFFVWFASLLARSKSWWLGGIVGGFMGFIFGSFTESILMTSIMTVSMIILGLVFDYFISKAYTNGKKAGHIPWWAGGGNSSSGGFGGGFGGFGGGSSGGGGASGGW
ncbi:MAG: TPM domain-containing protein [Candidatus Moranbacteria bacterium]|nr:TPM domain-containing protein [Candidatus Moranbacteria bacterium]